ncbi:hypothetical protein JCM6294_735 [Bacteroides pyogenes DSM 20611 = JCM 6294]|uniref:Uncharacterized protein n=1 Tax=Bacteroides pyogenes DSM 20611 = JCM 6294 TaxID=1121100 RepID=W4PFJ9_9BACE|nr:hypothetical protein JCM6294_735 [Bacteroides pyogenes DSM 20611 = JCM 6294]
MGADAGTKTGKNAKIDQNIFLKKIYLLSPLFIKCSLRRSPPLYEILVTNSGTKCYRRKKVFHLLFAFTEPFLPSGRGSVLRLQRLRFYSTEALFYIGAKASFFVRRKTAPPKNRAFHQKEVRFSAKNSPFPSKTVHFGSNRSVSVHFRPFRFIFAHFGPFRSKRVRRVLTKAFG